MLTFRCFVLWGLVVLASMPVGASVDISRDLDPSEKRSYVGGAKRWYRSLNPDEKFAFKLVTSTVAVGAAAIGAIFYYNNPPTPPTVSMGYETPAVHHHGHSMQALSDPVFTPETALQLVFNTTMGIIGSWWGANHTQPFIDTSANGYTNGFQDPTFTAELNQNTQNASCVENSLMGSMNIPGVPFFKNNLLLVCAWHRPTPENLQLMGCMVANISSALQTALAQAPFMCALRDWTQGMHVVSFYTKSGMTVSWRNYAPQHQNQALDPASKTPSLGPPPSPHSVSPSLSPTEDSASASFESTESGPLSPSGSLPASPSLSSSGDVSRSVSESLSQQEAGMCDCGCWIRSFVCGAQCYVWSKDKSYRCITDTDCYTDDQECNIAWPQIWSKLKPCCTY